MKKNVTKMSKRIIGLVAAAVMSVSMLAVGGMTASAASEYQNSNYAVCDHIDGKAIRTMTVYVSPEWQKDDANLRSQHWLGQGLESDRRYQDQ